VERLVVERLVESHLKVVVVAGVVAVLVENYLMSQRLSCWLADGRSV
jgi:hypothetical protein